MRVNSQHQKISKNIFDAIVQKYCRDVRLGAARITLYFFLLKLRLNLPQAAKALEPVNSRRVDNVTVSHIKILLRNKKEENHESDSLHLAPQIGLEPMTPRLTAACSTD